MKPLTKLACQHLDTCIESGEIKGDTALAIRKVTSDLIAAHDMLAYCVQALTEAENIHEHKIKVLKQYKEIIKEYF